uniref:Uncharacterized protein n=1 Tax=Panagrolaimus sp. PS1159 TaxID=55785 RepID=A0AC35G055_9BILA
MLRDPAFSENEELKSWFKHHQHVLFERCSLRSRLKAGYGFDTASTNTNECHNKLFKEDINNKKLPLHELIPKIEDYCFKTLEYGFDAILHGREYKLSKAKRELKTSPKEWESLTLEQKSAIMKKLGYGDWFDHPRTRPSIIPLFLLEHLENVQRKNLETRAIELSKFCLFDDSGEVKAVVDKDSRRTVQRFA